jgi:sugar phosphate isomerase/epimerase
VLSRLALAAVLLAGCTTAPVPEPGEVRIVYRAVPGELDSLQDTLRKSGRLEEAADQVERVAGLPTDVTVLVKSCKDGTQYLVEENRVEFCVQDFAEVRKVIPQEQDAGVKIAIESVWNDFISKPEQIIKYVDQFNTPTVGAYFDISNMIKYGVPPAQWIRMLGKRMLKFDFKGYHVKNGWVAISEGSEDWPEVLKALAEVGYNGWATAEVGGGGEDVLRDISRRMDKVLNA